MLYNGVELPDIESVWTDKVTYPYVVILDNTDENRYLMSFGSHSMYLSSGGYLRSTVDPHKCTGYFYKIGSSTWTYDYKADASSSVYSSYPESIIWSSHDILWEDGTLFLAGSGSVDPNAPVESPVMDILGTTADSSSITTDFSISGTSADSLYTIKASCFSGLQVVASTVVGPYSGPEFQATLSLDGLSPSTEYTVEYILSKDGEYKLSQTVTVTTAAASGSGSGDGSGDDSGSCACPSILNSILSVITAQTNFLSTWQQTWTSRMDSLESTLSKLIPVPDPTETALKESVKDTTKEVTDSLFADDAPTKVTASDVKDVVEIGSAASSMFDSGVSIGAFFDALNNVSFLSVFTQEMVNSMNTVNAVSAISEDGFDSTEYYHKNLEEIRDFVNGG